MTSHGRWEELAAGHALSALEPEEESELVRHLAGCRRCQDVHAEHAFVAAQLGSLLDVSDAPDWHAIRGGVVPGASVVSLEQARLRRRSPLRTSAAAAAVLLLAGGALVLRPGSGPQATAEQLAVRACSERASCHVVALQDRATLIVQAGSVRLLPARMATAPVGQVYVLWQLPRDGRPTMVATLTETRSGRMGEEHRLALSYESTAAFGVSVETSRSVPTQPTEILAVGTA